MTPPFTGERLMPYLGEGVDQLFQYGLMAYSKKMYHFVAERCNGKRVLDVSSGTGYGLALLYAQSRGATWGTDTARDIVGFAARYYESLASHLLVCDSLDIAVSSHQFDVVSAIEVIERVRSAKAFLTELVRVVRPNGTCILSTPNHPVVSPHAPTVSPFRIKAYDYAEFSALLREFFHKVQMYCVLIHHRIFLVRYVPLAVRFIPPFPLAHIERHLYWHFPPWNRTRVGLADVEMSPRYNPRCFGFLAVCSDPRKE
jgi:2-polyprenyl-3-methyl-5-hydroxy-6-metoxy-1,4-benzoquinol methylase